MQMVRDARAERLPEPYFLDLNRTLIEEDNARGPARRRAGAAGEPALRAAKAMGLNTTSSRSSQ